MSGHKKTASSGGARRRTGEAPGVPRVLSRTATQHAYSPLAASNARSRSPNKRHSSSTQSPTRSVAPISVEPDRETPQLDPSMFNPAMLPPLDPSAIDSTDVERMRVTLISPRCHLLPITDKAALTNEQIRMLMSECGPQPVYAHMFVSYLNALGVQCTSMQHLHSALNTLKADSQQYKIDLYLHFNSDLSSPTMNEDAIERVFVNGGFITLSSIHALALRGAAFHSIRHLHETVAAQAPIELAKLPGYRDSLVRFLSGATLADCMVGEAGDDPSRSSFAPPLLSFSITHHTIRRLLYIGATVRQLLHLFTRIRAAQKGVRVNDEYELLERVKEEWSNYRAEVESLLEWMRSPKNQLFVETSPAEQSGEKDTTIVHVPTSSIDTALVERIYTKCGLGELTLSVLTSLNAKHAKFQSIDGLMDALRTHGESMESMARLHAYLNASTCTLWSSVNGHGELVSERAINDFLEHACPAGTTPTLLLHECQMYERNGWAWIQQRQDTDKDGNASTGTAEEEEPTVDEVNTFIPPQFSNWAELCDTLMRTLPQALAQQHVDRQNLRLTLQPLGLMLPQRDFASLDSDDALTAPHPPRLRSRPYSDHDLDTLLGIVYELEDGSSNTAAKHTRQMALMTLFSHLRTFSKQQRRFNSVHALHRALRADILAESGIQTGPLSSPKHIPVAVSPDLTMSPILSPTGAVVTSDDRAALRSFFNDPERRLFLATTGPLTTYNAASGTAGKAVTMFRPVTDAEVDVLIREKNNLAAANLTGSSLPANKKDVPLTSTPIFIAALRYIERHLTQPFINVHDMLPFIHEHYKLLAGEMSDTLRYLKTSQRLFRDATLTITWNLGRDMVQLYAEGEADLDTLPIIRRLQRERYKEPFTSLSDLITAVHECMVENVRRAQNEFVTEDERRHVLDALLAASATPDSYAFSDVQAPPLMSVATLNESSADEQIDLLLRDYSPFTLLQHITSISHALTVKAAEEAPQSQAGSAASSPLLSPKRALLAKAEARSRSSSNAGTARNPSHPMQPAFMTWQELNNGIHESVLESNRLRCELYELLSSPSSALLSKATTPVPMTFEVVERIVKSTGLMMAECLAILQQLAAKNVHLKGLNDLVSRIKSFHADQRKAEAQAARYTFMKEQVMAYLLSDACHLFVSATAKAQVKAELDDPPTFAHFMSVSGGSIKLCLQQLHALETDELAFDSLASLEEGMRTWKVRQALKRKLVAFINDPQNFVLLDRTQIRRWRDVRLDDHYLTQLLNTDLNEEAMAELAKHPPSPLTARQHKHERTSSVAPSQREDSTRSAPSNDQSAVETTEATRRIELIIDFLYRLNENKKSNRFTLLKDLVEYVQGKLIKLNTKAEEKHMEESMSNSHIPGTPYFGGRDGTATPLPNFNRRLSIEQRQVGYDSDEDVDPREWARDSALLSGFSGHSPLSPTGPAGLSRKGTMVRPSAAQQSPHMRGVSYFTGIDEEEEDGAEEHQGSEEEEDDLEETAEEKAREEERKAARAAEKAKREAALLAKHGWVLEEDEDWLKLDRDNIDEPEMTEEILNERRMVIFTSLSYPACQLFSNRVEPMSLSDIDLDAVLSSAGGGWKGLSIALNIIGSLDRNGAKYMWFDQVTLEIARRWQRRKALEYLTDDPKGKKLLEGSSISLPLFVLRLMLCINRSHGVDPAICAADLLQVAAEVHPDPFSHPSELLQLVKQLVIRERHETLKITLTSQFTDIFSSKPSLTDAKLDLLLGGVDDSLYHALKYIELVQAEVTTAPKKKKFNDVLDLIPLITSMHSREKGAVPDIDVADLEEETGGSGNAAGGLSHAAAVAAAQAAAEEAADLAEAEAAAKSEDALMMRRQKIFMALSYPKCHLFTGMSESLTLTDVDLDDVAKASNNRLTFALRTIGEMDKEKIKFKSFYSAVLELTRRCQLYQASTFLLSHENQLLHHSVKLPSEVNHPEMVSLVGTLLRDGMKQADPYLNILACLKALNQVPKVLAQSPPSGGFRSLDDLAAAVRSLANEQRVWMVKSYFLHTTLRVKAAESVVEGNKRVRQPPSDEHTAHFLHVCGNSVYFVIRHLQTLELRATQAPKPPKGQSRGPAHGRYTNYEQLIEAIAEVHRKAIAIDTLLAQRFTPSEEPVAPIEKPNEVKQMQLQKERQEQQRATPFDTLSKERLLLTDHPHADKLLQAAVGMLQLEKDESPAAAAAMASAPAPPPLLPPTRTTPAFLRTARFQLLHALSYPKSHLFAKCTKAVIITDAHLDRLLKTPPEEDPTQPPQPAPVQTDEPETETAAGAQRNATESAVGALAEAEPTGQPAQTAETQTAEAQADTQTQPAAEAPTITSQGQAEKKDQPADGDKSNAVNEWVPTPRQVSECLRIIRHFDSCHYRFQSFNHFLTEVHAFIQQEQRQIILDHLAYPNCKLLSEATEPIAVDEAQIDELIRLAAQPATSTSTSSSTSSPAAHPIARLIACIERLDASNARVNSFDELIQLITKTLAEPTRAPTPSHHEQTPQQPPSQLEPVDGNPPAHT